MIRDTASRSRTGSSKCRKIFCMSSKARFTRRFTGLKRKVGSKRNGASPITIAKRGITNSPPPAANNSPRKRSIGSASPKESISCCREHRKYMPNVRAWFSRLFGVFQKGRRNAEMAEEMQTHVDLLIERNIAAGMLPHEARNAALKQFGGVEQIKEAAREQRVWRWADEFVQDVRFGARMLFRNPGFSLLAILCLTLGIGTNAAVFSWIEGILLRPYPLVAHQGQMFALAGTTRGAERGGLSYPDFVDLQKNSTLFESFIIDRIVGTTLSVGDRAERASGGLVSANYFDALGVQPMLGRGFRPEEVTGRNAYPVTIISYLTWKDRYKNDLEIVGKTQYMNGMQHTIIGVAPEKFHGTFIGYSFNFWVPTSMQEAFDSTGYKMEDRGARWTEGYAFLKPGVTRQQAQAELDSIAQRLEIDFPETNRGRGVQILPF